MTRNTARRLAIQLSFAADASKLPIAEVLDAFFDEEHFPSLSDEDEMFSEFPDERSMLYIRRLTELITTNCETIDGLIEKYSRGWSLNRISHTAKAVLRCAVCEILYMDDIPNAAAINEAVELDKDFDEPDTVSYVNGVLGGLMRGENIV